MLLLFTVLAATSSTVSAFPSTGQRLPELAHAPNGTHHNGTHHPNGTHHQHDGDNNPPPAIAGFPKYDGARCANTTAHHYVAHQAWVRAEDYQITPDCWAYGVEGSYAAVKACAQRNVCFGTCSMTYKQCMLEWLQDPETKAAHANPKADQHTWNTLPLHQYFEFNAKSCVCTEVPYCRYGQC